MNKAPRNYLISIFALVFVFTLYIPLCLAVFSISVEPYEGGFDLRFGRVKVDDPKIARQVTIRVTTDIGKQYRVFQRIDKPMTTADGIEIEKNQFKMYTLINSNSRGTLERREEFPVMSSDTLLYTSDSAGDADSFKVVYTITPSSSQTAGSYYGRFIYVLQPIDSMQKETYEVVQAYCDLANEGSVELTTSSGFKSIRIASKDLESKSFKNPEITIDVKGNLGTRYRIYQQLRDGNLRGRSGERFDLDKVKYEVIDLTNNKSIGKGLLSDLKYKSLAFTSDDNGTAAKISIVLTPTDDFAQFKSDVYSGVINFTLETDKITPSLEPGFSDMVDLEFDIGKVFKITAAPVSDNGVEIKDGDSGFMQFGTVGFNEGVKENKVKIKVESNIGKRYAVAQKFSGPMQNENGHKIPEELFTFKLDKDIDTGATLKFDKDTPIKPGEDATLFISNEDGQGDDFVITYKLSTTSDTRGGNYNSSLSYLLIEL